MSGILAELRLAIRSLVQRPLFTVVAVVTVTIGIGANTTLFSVVNTLLLRPPAGVPDASRVVELGRTRGGSGFDTFSYIELEEMQQLGGVLELVAGYRAPALSFSVGGDGKRVFSFATSHEYFDILGVRPALGRFFTAAEDQVAGQSPVAVVSHAFWRAELDGDSAVIGRTISLNRHSFTVIGVTPADFHSHIPQLRPQIYIPLTMMPVAQPGFDAFEHVWSSWLQAIGRLSADGTPEQVNAGLATLYERLRATGEEFYENRGARASMLGGMPAGGRGGASAFLGVLMGIVGVILLVTCANVAGMLLARAAGREREIAIRLALGAGRTRLIRQLLIETLVLFVTAGVAGTLLSYWTTSLLAGIDLPTPFPIYIDFAPDVRVIAFGFAIALTTGVLFGLAPALQSTRVSLVPALKVDSGRAGSGASRLRRVFIGGQVALTVMLLITAGLFLRAMQRAGATNAGFSPDDVALMQFDLAIDGYDEQRGRAFQRALLERLAAAPGAAGAGFATDLPLNGSVSETPVYPEGWQGEDPERGLRSAFAFVNGDYFRALDIQLERGRVFGEADTPESMRVVMISRELAARAWPGQDPLGKRIRWGGSDADERVVVGVVADVKNQTLTEPTEPMIYLPTEQEYRAELSVVLRSSLGTRAAAEALERAVRAVDPQLSTTPIQTMKQYAAIGLLPQRVATFMTTGFGTLALLLSTVGVYGVMAFMVAQRTREIGIRMAIGADRAGVVRLVVLNGLRLALPGALLGGVAGLGLGFLLRSFILGVSPTDPLTFIGAPAALLLAVLLACCVPAARAAAVEPSRALRAD